MSIHIGTSGWSYPHWDGSLYPVGLPAAQRLAVYASEFETAELNASFYRWPRDATFAGWRERLAPPFLLSVKAPRGLTHGKRLFEPDVWIDRIARSWHELGARRGMLVVQLPPTFERDDPRLDYFLGRMPSWIRVTVEFRHVSWLDDRVFEVLERHNAAYCVMSGANLPCVLRATTDTVYVRMHGPDHEHLYGGSYSDEDLSWWADRVREWSGSGRDVFVYFNNDGGGNAVRNARTLRHCLSP